jgi:hypothetical protein
MELVAWVNDLLQISYTKIEQCGAGGAYCQIIDSIYCKYRVTLAIVLPYFVSPCTLLLIPSSFIRTRSPASPSVLYNSYARENDSREFDTDDGYFQWTYRCNA